MGKKSGQRSRISTRSSTSVTFHRFLSSLKSTDTNKRRRDALTSLEWVIDQTIPVCQRPRGKKMKRWWSHLSRAHAMCLKSCSSLTIRYPRVSTSIPSSHIVSWRKSFHGRLKIKRENRFLNEAQLVSIYRPLRHRREDWCLSLQEELVTAAFHQWRSPEMQCDRQIMALTQHRVLGQ